MIPKWEDSLATVQGVQTSQRSFPGLEKVNLKMT